MARTMLSRGWVTGSPKQQLWIGADCRVMDIAPYMLLSLYLENRLRFRYGPLYNTFGRKFRKIWLINWAHPLSMVVEIHRFLKDLPMRHKPSQISKWQREGLPKLPGIWNAFPSCKISIV